MYRFAAVLITSCLVLAGCSDGSDRRPGDSDDREPVPLPSVSDPPDSGQPSLLSTTFDLGSVGYKQREYFLSGTASAFRSDEALTEDGRWQAVRSAQADYRTRVLVYRPQEDVDFSGSVFVEWLNVTTGFELPVSYGTGHTELLRSGHAVVLVSAQFVGIEGAENPLLPLHLKAVNPERYGTLSHPGDSFSYDIFTQVAGALLEGGSVDILEGLQPEQLYAMGQSQSASRLVTYYNAIQPLYGAFDGFFLQNRGDGSSDLSEGTEGAVPAPDVVILRTDLNAPVINVQSETDVLGLNSVAARQTDDKRFRLWEVAGTSHNDEYTFVSGRTDDGTDPRFALVVEQTSILGFQECDLPMNSGHLVWPVNAAMRALDTWARNDEAPTSVDRLKVTTDGSAFELDENGNALGGLRSPYVEAPAAVLSGLGQNSKVFCGLFGTTELFDRSAMISLYGDQQGYIAAVDEAAQRAIDNGVLLTEDALRILEAAPLQWDTAPEFRRIPLPDIEAIAAPNPTLLGPDFDLSEVNYQEAEYFVSGTATGFINTSELGENGLWSIDNNGHAEYKSRFVVHRPSDAADFSGTVFVEWQNVSAGFETAPVWYAGHTEALRSGHAWVFVSAQRVGIEGSPNALLPFHLKAANPERYESLSHPGDSFSYDLFSQVARAVRDGDVLGGLKAEQIIGVGQSQSAGFLATYVNAVHPLYNAYDAYLIHSRAGGSYPLAFQPQQPIHTPSRVPVRDDLNVPVIDILTETDLFILNAVANRQADSAMFRRWEVPGTSHADYYTTIAGRADKGDDPRFAVIVEENQIQGGVITCDRPINAGPMPWVVNAALSALVDWAQDGQPASMGEFISLSDDQSTIVRDLYGNAEGGIRSPHLDVPAATLSGEGQTGTSFCGSFGTTDLFDAATMASLYVDKNGYMQQVAESVDQAFEAEFLLSEDAERIKAAAALQWDLLEL
jgi:hypothetical protein